MTQVGVLYFGRTELDCEDLIGLGLDGTHLRLYREEARIIMTLAIEYLRVELQLDETGVSQLELEHLRGVHHGRVELNGLGLGLVLNVVH